MRSVVAMLVGARLLVQAAQARTEGRVDRAGAVPPPSAWRGAPHCMPACALSCRPVLGSLRQSHRNWLPCSGATVQGFSRP
jgi:hypothetical protein